MYTIPTNLCFLFFAGEGLVVVGAKSDHPIELMTEDKAPIFTHCRNLDGCRLHREPWCLLLTAAFLTPSWPPLASKPRLKTCSLTIITRTIINLSSSSSSHLAQQLPLLLFSFPYLHLVLQLVLFPQNSAFLQLRSGSISPDRVRVDRRRLLAAATATGATAAASVSTRSERSKNSSFITISTQRTKNRSIFFVIDVKRQGRKTLLINIWPTTGHTNSEKTVVTKKWSLKLLLLLLPLIVYPSFA